MRSRKQQVTERKPKSISMGKQNTLTSNPYRIIRGLDKIAAEFSVPTGAVLNWIERYGFPVSKLEGDDSKDNNARWFAVQIDMIRWLRVWRVSSFLDLTMQKMEPPELRRRIMQMRTREKDAEREAGRKRARKAAQA